MADERKQDSGTISQPSSALKRSYKETEPGDKEDDFFDNNLSSSPKKLKGYPYRDQNNESLDTDSLRNTFELDSPSFSNSLDSGTWPTSWSKNTSTASLELSSVIQRYDNTNLNSLTMTSVCENAISSPFPQSWEMGSPSQPKVPSLNSISMKEMLLFSGNISAESIDMVSLSSQSSVMNEGELVDNFTGNIVTETRNSSSFLTTTLGTNKMKQVAVGKSSGNERNIASSNTEQEYAKSASTSLKCKYVAEEKHLNTDNPRSSRSKETKYNKKCSETNNEGSSITSSCQEIPSLLKKYNTCEKKSGHNRFYSPKDLKVTHLPPEIQHEDTVTFFQCLSKLVVQIKVSYTSEKRSKNDVYSSFIGTNKNRDGSGFIASTDENIMKIKCTRKNCSCNEEIESSSTRNVPVCEYDRSMSNISTTSSTSSPSTNKKHFIYGGVYVKTNRHVIFDKSEADNACVNFFFNSANGKEVIEGHVFSIHGVNNEQDHITLHVLSHNKLLNDTINMHIKNAKSSYTQMIKSTHNIQQIHDTNKHSWVAVMSYPHGIPISISFGQLKNEEAETKRVIKYYDASTCPGSSGGLVVTPTLLHLQWPGAVHSSFCQKSKYNVSLDSRFQELEPSVINDLNKNILNRKDSAPEYHYRI